MKRFATILAFLIVFIPANVGVMMGVGLAEDAGKGPPHPVAGLIVGAFSVCLGIFGGTYAARTTWKHYTREATTAPR